MRVAIQLAEGVKGQTTPNPPVGAVVVKDGRMIGFGAHLKYGEAHAEKVALEMAGKEAEDAVIYVTLEPCCHQGKTGPCAALIIEKKLKRVVIACEDPNEKVAGKGIRQLKEAGIAVEVGVLQKEAAVVNKEFFHTIQKGLPYVTIKTAMSLDGKTATSTGESKWITSEAAREDAHFYRHQHDAILVGIQTVLADNPSLTTRISGGKQPIRIVLDTQLRTPIDAKIVTDNLTETWIFVGEHAPLSKKRQFSQCPSVRIVEMAASTLDVEDVLMYLHEKRVSTVLVEGGGMVNDSFLRKGLINQLIMYIAPKVIGGKKANTPFTGEGFTTLEETLNLKIDHTEMVGNDMKVIASRKEVSYVHGDCRGNG